MVVYKVFHNIWSYWLGSLGEIFKGIGAAMPPSPALSQGLVPVCAFTPLWLQPCSCLDPREWVRGAACSPQPLSWLLCAVLVLHPELGPELAGWGAGGDLERAQHPAAAPSTWMWDHPSAPAALPPLSDAFLLKAGSLPCKKRVFEMETIACLVVSSLTL